MIRLAQRDDLPVLREIERRAGEAFREIGMAAVGDDEPLSLDELAVYQRGGRAWVATDEDDRPIAYVLVRNVDANAHIEQISVHPDQARHGIGAKLIETVASWAKDQHLVAMTLTTFADVPWNAPYYQRLGFSAIAEAEMTEGLRRIRHDEAARGLTAWPRLVMRRSLQD